MKNIRNVLPILALTFSFNIAKAFDESLYYAAQQASQEALESQNQEHEMMSQDEADYMEPIDADASAEDIATLNDRMGLANKCDNFAVVKSYGTWGKAAYDALGKTKMEALLEGTPDLIRACPNYKSMPLDDQKSIWILILNTMAHYESSCNPSVKVRPGVTKGRKLVGILQLDLGYEQTYTPTKAGGGCGRMDGTNPVKSVTCTLSMLRLQVVNRGLLFSEKSYWDVLRKNSKSRVKDAFTKGNKTSPAKQIDLAVQQYPGCSNNTKLRYYKL